MGITLVIPQKLNLSKRNIRSFVKEALNLLGVKKASLSIALVDRGEIRRINREFRGIDRETDVISFFGYDENYLGDIVISYEVVRENAQFYSEDPDVELRRVIIHGILHLLGYRDYEEEEKSRMFEKQEEILRLLDGYKLGFE